MRIWRSRMWLTTSAVYCSILSFWLCRERMRSKAWIWWRTTKELDNGQGSSCHPREMDRNIKEGVKRSEYQSRSRGKEFNCWDLTISGIFASVTSFEYVIFISSKALMRNLGACFSVVSGEENAFIDTTRVPHQSNISNVVTLSNEERSLTGRPVLHQFDHFRSLHLYQQSK